MKYKSRKNKCGPLKEHTGSWTLSIQTSFKVMLTANKSVHG